MPSIYLMQRANGEIFTTTNGIALWSGKTTLEISRAHNLDLDLYRPIQLDKQVIAKLKRLSTEPAKLKLWLVEPLTGAAQLGEGHTTNWPELEELLSQATPEPVANHPKVHATIQEFHFN